jgi:polar amino acid transport system permease protein
MPTMGPTPTGATVKVERQRHPARWASAAVVLFLVFMFVQSLVTNKNMHWDVVGHYMFDHSVLGGLLVTVRLTVMSMVLGIVGGVILAIMRLSPNPVLSTISALYIWFFRGTPLLVQLLFFYFLAALFPRLGLGIPYGPTFVSGSTNVLITQFVAAVLAFGLNEAAYMAEIVRAGIISVDGGQSEAAAAIGLSRAQTLRHIVLPQAMRIIIPPTTNNAVSLLKTTSLVLLIAIPDLLTSVQLIYSRNFLQIPLLTVACIWYLAVTTVVTVIQYYVEQHFSRGVNARAPGIRRMSGSTDALVAEG